MCVCECVYMSFVIVVVAVLLRCVVCVCVCDCFVEDSSILIFFIYDLYLGAAPWNQRNRNSTLQCFFSSLICHQSYFYMSEISTWTTYSVAMHFFKSITQRPVFIMWILVYWIFNPCVVCFLFIYFVHIFYVFHQVFPK